MHDLTTVSRTDATEHQAPVRVSSQDKLMALVQKKYPDYHPVVALVDLAHLTQDESIEFGCHKEVAKYLVAVDKFVEVKSEVTKIKRVTVQLFGAPDQPKAIEDRPSPVLDVHGREISDVRARGVAVEQGEVETVGRQTVHSSGPIEEAEEPSAARSLVGVWGDGTSHGAGRFA